MPRTLAGPVLQASITPARLASSRGTLTSLVYFIMLLAKPLREAHWEPSFGDPTVLGWVTVGCYLFAAIVCFICWHRRRNLIDASRVRRLGCFWLSLTLGMVLLGVNKQLDLQGLAHVSGRNLAIRQGWFDHRHALERAAVITLGIVGVLSVAAVLLLMRGLWRTVWLAVAGVGLIAGFAVLRAAELWDLISLTKIQRIGPLQLSQAIELAAIAFIVAGSLACILRPDSTDLEDSRRSA